MNYSDFEMRKLAAKIADLHVNHGLSRKDADAVMEAYVTGSIGWSKRPSPKQFLLDIQWVCISCWTLIKHVIIKVWSND